MTDKTRVRRLVRDPTQALTDGCVFEFKEAGLVAARLRALRRHHPGLRFDLATNVLGANPFDDVVVRLNWSDDAGRERAITYFVQLKHKENPELIVKAHHLASSVVNDRNKDFNLRRYYNNFKEGIRYFVTAGEKKRDRSNGTGDERAQFAPSLTSTSKKSNSNKGQAKKKKINPNEDVLEEWLKDDYRLIFLTTAKVLPKEFRAPSPEDFPFEEIFYTGQGEIFSFGETDPEIWDMFAGTPEDADFRSNFLRRLRIFSGQAQVSGFEALLQSALANALDIVPVKAERLLTGYSTYLEKWWSNKDGDCLSEETAEIEEIVRNELHKQLIKLTFQPTFYEDLSERLRCCSSAYIVVHGIPPKLRCSALAPALNILTDRFLMITETAFRDYPVEVLKVMCSKLCSKLVLSIDSMDDKLRSFLDEILSQKKYEVIIVSSEWDERVYDFLCRRRAVCSTWSEHWALEHLVENDQRILQDRRVCFQGCETTLAELQRAWPFQEWGVRGATLADLVAESLVTLGSPLPTVDGLYLPRILDYSGSQLTVLRLSVLKLRCSTDRFILRNFPQADLKRLREPDSGWEECNFLWVRKRKGTGESEAVKTEWTDWDKAPKPMKWRGKKNVHLLTYEGGRIVHTCLERITEYQALLKDHVKEGYWNSDDESINEEYDAERLVNKLGIMFLVSEPGMGKSSFVTRMAQVLKENYPTECVVLVRINQQNLMEMTSEEINARSIIDLLARVAQPEPPSHRDTIKHLIRNSLIEIKKEKSSVGKSGMISIIIDGFDEVCPTYKAKVLSMLRFLLYKTRFQRLWITTRPVQEESLVDTLNRPPFRLRPFSREDQLQFLLQSWCGVRMATDAESKLCIAFLDSVRAATEHGGQTLCDVPLYMRMLADAYRNEFTLSVESDVTNWNLNINRLKIMQKFLDENRKRHLFSIGVPKDAVANAKLDKESEKAFLDSHKTCATYILFDKDTLSVFYKTVKEEVNTFLRDHEREKTGIIMKVMDERPVFIHRIFTEYFAALWLSDKYKQLPKLMETLYSGELEDVRFFFDALLAGDLALHAAVQTGRRDAVEAALRRGAALEEADSGGRSALHLAAISGHRDPLHALLERGAKVVARDAVRGWTPLRYADALLRFPEAHLPLEHLKDACPAHLEVVEHLLRHRAPLRDARRLLRAKDALHFALKKDFANVTKLFLKSGVPGISGLIRKLRPNDYLHVASKYGSLDVVKLLIGMGFNLNSSSKDDESKVPLHIAAERGDKSLCDLLLKHGARVSKADKQGDTPLHKAARGGHTAVCELFVKHRAKVDVPNGHGRTALSAAAERGYKEVCSFLIDKGACVDSKDARGKTIIAYAEEMGHASTCHLLRGKAVRQVNRVGRDRRTALHMAALRGNEEQCRSFLEIGAEDLIWAKDMYGNTALHLAARQGNVTVCVLLLEHGAQVNDKDNQGNSALHSAVQYGQAEVCRALLEGGADLLARNTWGESVYNMARAAQNEAVIEVLNDAPCPGETRRRGVAGKAAGRNSTPEVFISDSTETARL